MTIWLNRTLAISPTPVISPYSRSHPPESNSTSTVLPGSLRITIRPQPSLTCTFTGSESAITTSPAAAAPATVSPFPVLPHRPQESIHNGKATHNIITAKRFIIPSFKLPIRSAPIAAGECRRNRSTNVINKHEPRIRPTGRKQTRSLPAPCACLFAAAKT